jgi:hypothetical protein
MVTGTALLIAAGCGSASRIAVAHTIARTPSTIVAPDTTPAAIRISPLTPLDAERITPVDAAAILALGSNATRPAPDIAGHDMSSMSAEMPLSAADAPRFAEQWAAAQQAVPRYDTIEKAAAVGYVRASTPAGGIGTHWVLWPQVAKPFDPARPAMLLFDERKTPSVLVGFSYWVQSATIPDGFAGDSDMWHQHSGYCVVNGWLDREETKSPDDCSGTFIAGGDLWMLHAWVVPRYSNHAGNFAVFHRALCPPIAGTPDDLRCPT